MSEHDKLIADNARLRAIVRAEVALTAAAYGLELPPTTPPVEVPPAQWVAARDEEDQRLGVRLFKFFWSPSI